MARAATLVAVLGFMLLCTLANAALHRRVASEESDPYRFPKYLQCDPRWGNNKMGTNGNGERSTICGEGCAMTSTSMALAGLGVKTPDGNLVTPATFNDWLMANNGYYCAAGDCNNLNLTAPENFARVMTLIGENQKHSYAEIVANIKSGAVLHVAHVRNNSHFVLLTGPANVGYPAFQVHDPYYPVSVYPYENITDIITFHRDKYPMYKQCDPKWANVVMGKNGDTICDVGCLMSSITMALAGTGIQEYNQTAIPSLTNTFLQTHNGYAGNSSALDESVIALIDPSRIVWPTDGFHFTNDLPWTTIQSYLDRDVPRIVIANVLHGEHFVLVTGYRADGDSLVVNDPGFPTATYSYSNDVVGWRIFDMK